LSLHLTKKYDAPIQNAGELLAKAFHRATASLVPAIWPDATCAL